MTVDTRRAGRREWLGLAVLVLPCLLITVDASVLVIALPWLAADLAPSSTQQLWIIDAYGFLVSGALIPMGALGDRVGRRRLLLAGAAAFGVASVLAAFAPTAEALIGARVLLGVAAGTLMPSTLSLIRTMFCDERQRTLAIGVWSASFSGGMVAGPLLGGLLLQTFWWGSVFLVNVPVMVLLLLLAPLLLPEYRGGEPSRFDPESAVLALAAVLLAVYGVKQLAAAEGSPAVPVLAIVAGVTVGVGFVRRQRRLTDPMLDVELFRVRAFSTSVGVSLLAVFAWIGFTLYVSQYLQLVVGMEPLHAGLWSLPGAGGVLVGSLLGPALTRWVRPGFLVSGGLALAAAGFALLTRVGVDSMATLLVGNAVACAGTGVVIALATGLVVSTAPPERAGAASAVSEAGTDLGGALGFAVLGSVGAAVYRDRLAESAPAGADLETARETLPAAVSLARQLPDAAGAALLRAAREAFADGIAAVATIGASLLVTVAVATAVLLRRTSTGEPGGDG